MLHCKLCSQVRFCCGFCAAMLCIVNRHSLHIRGMVACHIDHVVYLRKHALVTCLVNAQRGWSLQMSYDQLIISSPLADRASFQDRQHTTACTACTQCHFISAFVECERKHLGCALKGAVLNEGGAGNIVLLALRAGAIVSIAALLLVTIKVDLDVGGERVVMCWRGTHVVEGHQVCSQITQPLQKSGSCPHEHIREDLHLLSALLALCCCRK